MTNELTGSWMLTSSPAFAVGPLFGTFTKTSTSSDAVAPKLSVARAVIKWVPSATSVHVKAYGLERSSPSFVLPLKNSTRLIVPLAILAVAVNKTDVPATKVEFGAGLVMATTGGLAPAPTVMLTAVDVAVPLRLLVALAVRVWLPTESLFHAKVCGLVRSSPSLTAPLKNST